MANLPSSLPVPIVVATHRADNFPDARPEYFATRSPLSFKVASHMKRFGRGCVYFPPPHGHIGVDRSLRCRIDAGQLISRFRPSVDYLFNSAADAFGPRVLAVILSGRLNDGACGALRIRRNGGVVIAQCPDSCRAASMPLATIDNGSASYILGPVGISRALVSLTMVAGSRALFGASRAGKSSHQLVEKFQPLIK